MPTFQELLAQIQGSQPQGGSHLMSALAPFMGGGGGAPAMGSGLAPANPLDAQIQAQIAARSEPPPVVDDPVGPQSKPWQRVLAAIANAGSAYGGAMTGSRPQDFLGPILGQDQMNLDRAAGNKAKRLKAEYEGRQTKAELELQRLMGVRADEAAKTKRQQELDDDAARQQAAIALENLRSANELAKQRDDQEFDTKLENIRFSHDKTLKGLEDAAKNGDKNKEKDLERYSSGARIASGFNSGLPAEMDKQGNVTAPAVPPLAKRLANGESPAEIRREFELELTKEGVFGHGRDLARDTFNEMMLHATRAAQAAPGGP